MSFLIGCHAYDSDVTNSDLSEPLKQAFLNALHRKHALQDVYNAFESKSSERLFDKMSFVKSSVVDSLRKLMEAARPNAQHWPPRFDSVFKALADYEFPFEMENAWYVDGWIQYVHELITALFLVCGGFVHCAPGPEYVPAELKQPESAPVTASRRARRSLEFPLW